MCYIPPFYYLKMVHQDYYCQSNSKACVLCLSSVVVDPRLRQSRLACKPQQPVPYRKVYGHNTTDKTPMYEIPLIFVFGVGESIFCVGVLGVGVLSRDHFNCQNKFYKMQNINDIMMLCYIFMLHCWYSHWCTREWLL